MASDEKRSAVDNALACFADDGVALRDCDDIDAAREGLRALRASLNDAQVQEYMSRCRGDVLAEMNDALRAENAAMREALEKIADAGYPWVTTIARTALGGSDE